MSFMSFKGEEVKLSLDADNMCLYEEKPKDSISHPISTKYPQNETKH